MSARMEFLRLPARPWLRAVVSGTIFAIAYHFAYRYGMSFSPNVPAPLWFPDTVLLCALLLSPPRTWPWFVLGTAPLRLFLVPSGGPAWFLLAAFANDSIKGVLAATLLRKALPNPIRFDRLRDFSIYVTVAVLGVPILSALAGAASWRALGRGFWPSWQAWFLGNAMTNLVLTPAVLYWFFGYRDRRRGFHPRHLAEGLLLTFGLAGLGLAAFSDRLASPYDTLALLYAPVAFLMWAAIRFGLKGASAALTLSAMFAAAAAASGRHPFAGLVPDERVLWIELFLLAVALPVLFLAALVSERDQSVAALRQSEERYREIVNTQSDLICRYLPDTTLTFVNEAYCRYFGRTREELIGTRFLDLMPAPAREAASRHVASLVANPSAETNEHEVLLPDGSIGWQQWVDHAVTGRDGRVIEFQAMGRDITDRKHAEEADRRLARAARLSQLGELTASIAHEINQPLGAILSNADAADMLLERGPDGIAEVRAILSDIRRDDLRASDVIDHVRSLLTRHDMKLQPLDINAVAGYVLRLATGDVKLQGVTVETDFDGTLPAVRGDRVSLEQVLLNLIRNASEAMTDSNGAARRLCVSTRRHDRGSIEVAVSDSGQGIPSEILPRLFDSFVTTRKDGMGLGLSISRSIVQAHGGTITAENNDDRGATFRFTLPVQDV